MGDIAKMRSISAYFLNPKVIPTGGSNLFETNYCIRLREVNGEFNKFKLRKTV